MKSAKDVVENYNRQFKKTVVENKSSLTQNDLNAKAIVESLIENKFSVDVPTRKDAVNEILRLAESKSFIAHKMFELLENIMANCKVSEQGHIKFDMYAFNESIK